MLSNCSEDNLNSRHVSSFPALCSPEFSTESRVNAISSTLSLGEDGGEKAGEHDEGG